MSIPVFSDVDMREGTDSMTAAFEPELPKEIPDQLHRKGNKRHSQE
jgi:hypothetical protein